MRHASAFPGPQPPREIAGKPRSIYAFVELENKEATESEITVSFEAPDGRSATGNVKLDVGAEPRWRTWAYTRAARTAGSWTAIVKNRRGDVLARAPFRSDALILAGSRSVVLPCAAAG